MIKSRTHLWISDPQIKPNSITDHLEWAGLYVRDKRPDVIIIGGDWWDMSSLSTYDKGKKKSEGKRIDADLSAGEVGLWRFMKPWWVKGYKPSLRFQYGNHCERLGRYINCNAETSGILQWPGTFEDILSHYGWHTTPYLKYDFVDGIAYIHYCVNQFTGKPIGGTVMNRLMKVGFSFTAGHQQMLDLHIMPLGNGVMRRGLVQGAFYINDEDYIPHSGNNCWRGIILKTEVSDGSYNLVEVSIDYLCRKYEGMTIGNFLRKKYPNKTGTLWEKP